MKPQLEAFSITQDGEHSRWTKIGVAFPHKKEGFSIVLEALPIPNAGKCRIVVMPPKVASPDDEFNDPSFPFGK